MGESPEFMPTTGLPDDEIGPVLVISSQFACVKENLGGLFSVSLGQIS